MGLGRWVVGGAAGVGEGIEGLGVDDATGEHGTGQGEEGERECSFFHD
jgi:hypothetical protein